MAEKASERSVLFQCLCRLIALYHVIVTYICCKKCGAKVKTLLPFEAVGLQICNITQGQLLWQELMFADFLQGLVRTSLLH